MILYKLVLVITFAVGIQDPLILGADEEFHSLGECREQAEMVSNWLTQDFIGITYECQQYTKEDHHEES